MPFIKFIIRLLLLLLHEKAIPQFTPWERIFIFKMPADSNGNSKVKLSKVMWLQLQNTRCFFLIGCMPCLSRISTFYCICYMHPSLAGSSAHSVSTPSRLLLTFGLLELLPPPVHQAFQPLSHWSAHVLTQVIWVGSCQGTEVTKHCLFREGCGEVLSLRRSLLVAEAF